MWLLDEFFHFFASINCIKAYFVLNIPSKIIVFTVGNNCRKTPAGIKSIFFYSGSLKIYFDKNFE